MKRPLTTLCLTIAVLLGSAGVGWGANFYIICEGDDEENFYVNKTLSDSKKSPFTLILNVWSFIDKKSNNEHFYLSNEGAGYNIKPCFSVGDSESIVCDERQRLNGNNVHRTLHISRLSGQYREQTSIFSEHEVLGKTEWRSIKTGSCKKFNHNKNRKF